jgi:hypothetical protein
LTVGATSEVLLDKFVYDPTGSKGNVVFQATRGAFRVVTGTQDHRAYAVNTPYGSLGDASADAATVQPLGLREPGNFNREFEAIDREARAIFEPTVHEHDGPHVGGGALMAYGPGGNERGIAAGGSGGGVVEVVIAEKGKKLRPDECATKVRLVSGHASFTTTAGKVARLTEPNQTVCISANGSITHGSSSTSILPFQVLAESNFPTTTTAITTIPLTGGTGATTGPPITPCITQCSP